MTGALSSYALGFVRVYQIHDMTNQHCFVQVQGELSLIQ